jgi:hypothetical protein
LECRHEFDLNKICVPSSVRSICWDPFGNTLLIGFRSTQIFEISSVNGTDLHGGALLEGHAPQGELWGLGKSSWTISCPCFLLVVVVACSFFQLLRTTASNCI